MCTAAPDSAIDLLDASALDGIAPEWDELLTSSYDNRFFLSPRFHRIWWHHFGSDECRIITRRNAAGQLVAVLPLQIVERDARRVLTLLGDHNVADYMDGAALRDEADVLLYGLWCEALRRLRFDEIELRHVPAASPLLRALERAVGDAGLTFVAEGDQVCPVSLLCTNWEGYLQMLSKKQRHEIRRKFRRSTENAEWTWRTTRSQTDLRVDLEAFFTLHEMSASHKAVFLTPRMRAFFLELAAEYLALDMLRLSTFRVDGIDVASTFGFLHRDRYFLYNSGYNPAVAERNPGIAAVALAMQDAIEAKAVAFDFLSGDESYKYQFGAQNTYTSRATVR